MLEETSSNFGASADKPGGLDSISTTAKTTDVESTVHPLNSPDNSANQSQVESDTQAASSRASLKLALPKDEKVSNVRQSSSKTTPARADSVRQLPYRPNQQVEFLNLQVETEALLHQIQLYQRQRQTGDKAAYPQLATSALR